MNAAALAAAEFVLLAAIWGASFLFMRWGTAELGPFATAGLRVAVAAVFLLPLLALRGHLPSLRQHWRTSFFVGVLNSAIPFACFCYALQSISTGLSSIINASVPLFGALVAWAWLRERLDGWRAAGLAIGFIGVLWLAWDQAGVQAGVSPTQAWRAIAACLCACLCYALAASYTRRHLSAVPPLAIATGSQIGATLFLAPLAATHWPEGVVSQRAWVAVLCLGVLCTALAYVMYFRLIDRLGPSRALSVTYAIPVFALLYGSLLLGESVTLGMVGCALLVVLGTLLSSGALGRSRAAALQGG